MGRLAISLWLLFCLWPGIAGAGSFSGGFSVDLDSLRLENIDRALSQNVKGYKLGLALSGGGARGLAQIGILDEFQKAGIQIDLVAGTSIGGIVGGLYAAGFSPAQLEQVTRDIDWRGLFSDRPRREAQLFTQRAETEGELLSVRFEGWRPRVPTALSSGQRLMNILESLTQEPAYFSGEDFANLERPLAIVATDIVTGDKVVFTSGSLANAMRATSGVPLAFTPLELGPRLLLDGGLVDPIPTDEARKLGADFVIAVNTASPMLTKDEITDPVDIANQTTTIMQSEMRAQALATADFVLQPEMPGAKATDFSDLPALIEMGREATRPLIDSLKKALAEFKKNSENVFIDTVRFEGTLADDSLLEVWKSDLSDRTLSAVALQKKIYDLFLTGHYLSLQYRTIEHDGIAELVISGERLPLIQDVEIEGSTIFAESDLQQLTQRFVDGGLTLLSLRALERELTDDYHRLGFDLVQIAGANYEDGKLTLTIDEGRVTGVSVEGNVETRWWVAASYFTLKPGDLYSRDKASEGVRRIFASGLFENVQLKLSNRAGGVWITIVVKEKNYTYMKLGARYHEEFHPEAFLKVGYANVGGTGNDASLYGRFSELRKHYQAQLRADRIFRTTVTYNLRVYYRNDKIGLFMQNELTGYRTDKRWGVKLGVGQQLARFGLLDFTARYEQVRYKAPDQVEPTNRRVASLQFNLSYDTKDRYTFPTRGRASHLSFEIASDVLGGEEVFQKFEGYAESYQMLVPSLNLHLRGAIGLSQKGLPIYDRFYLGGTRSFIGYRVDQLSGDKYLLGNFDLRFGPWYNFYLHARYDIGEVFNRFEQLRFQQFRHAVGAILALDTLLGPVSFGYGRAEGKFDNLYLNIGYDF